MADTDVDILAVDSQLASTSAEQGYGLSDTGFVPKPFGRLLAEKLALARVLFGDDVDVSPGSVLRKVLELTALEDARTWAALSDTYDNLFVPTATGEALTRLGEELGLSRPFVEATGTVKLAATLPAGTTKLTLPRGARMLTPGQHDVATDEEVTFTPSALRAEIAVIAFNPGPDRNLDPSSPSQKISTWNPDDPKLAPLDAARVALGAATLEAVVSITHDAKLTGGERRWDDGRYRELLLRAPRSVWTADAVTIAVSLVPGVRLVQVKDSLGVLDVELARFGTFNFAERLFAADRQLASPYFFDVAVAPTVSAIWEGDRGLRAAVVAAIDEVRPVGVFAQVLLADQVFVGISGSISVSGLPLPRGPSGVVQDSAAAVNLKQRLLLRVGRYVSGLDFGEPVRFSEVMWALMNEPGIADVSGLELVRFPADPPGAGTVLLPVGANVVLGANQIATLAFDDRYLTLT
jgi:hypothetical protein